MQNVKKLKKKWKNIIFVLFVIVYKQTMPGIVLVYIFSTDVCTNVV